jgi:hypothetical protein
MDFFRTPGYPGHTGRISSTKRGDFAADGCSNMQQSVAVVINRIMEPRRATRKVSSAVGKGPRDHTDRQRPRGGIACQQSQLDIRTNPKNCRQLFCKSFSLPNPQWGTIDRRRPALWSEPPISRGSVKTPFVDPPASKVAFANDRFLMLIGTGKVRPVSGLGQIS